jgi:hypothetical protein
MLHSCRHGHIPYQKSVEAFLHRRLAIIVVSALLVRLLQVFASGAWSEPLRGEPTEEVRIAQLLAAGRGFVTPFYDRVTADLSASAHSPPAYPYFLAAVICVSRSLSDNTMLPYRFALTIGALMGAVAVGCLALAGERVAGWKGFWAVGGLTAIWPTLVTQSGILWDTPFNIVAVALGIWLATEPCPQKGRSAMCYLSLGLLGGIATLFNPIVAAFLAVATVARSFRKGSDFRPYVIMGGVWLICVAPWVIRNAIVLHRLIPIRHNLGLEVWLGNLPGSDGTSKSTLLKHPMQDPAERQLVMQLGESGYMQLKSHQAVELISREPGRFLHLTGRRMVLYWFGDTQRPTQLLGRTFPMILGVNLLKVAINGLLLGLAMIGLICWRPLPGQGVLGFGLLVLPAPFYITHVAANYRVFVDPLLCLLAGVFVARRDLFSKWVKMLARLNLKHLFLP